MRPIRRYNSRRFLIALLLFPAGFSTLAHAQCTLVEAAGATPPTGQSVYVYTLNAAACNAAPLPKTVKLDNLDSSFLISPVSGTITPTIVSGARVVQLTTPAGAPPFYEFSIAATASASIGSTTSPYTITYADGTTSGGVVNVPLATNPSQVPGGPPISQDESTIDILLGTGSHVTFSPYPDYNVQTSTVLVATGVGNATPVVLIGAGFTTGVDLLRKHYSKENESKENGSKENGSHYTAKRYCTHVLPDSIFVSLQAAIGSGASTSDSIAGYTFGGGYKIQRYVEVLGGYSLAQYNEPSPGFRAAAAATVTNNQNVPIYKQFNASDILADKPYALDGFPLLLQTVTATGTPGTPGGQIYIGTPLVNHYRGGLFIGLAFPISMSKLLLGH
jgi:hypothetical protein